MSHLAQTAVTAQLDRVLSSALFARSERLCTLLRFLVARAIENNPVPVKEYVLGVEVFGRRVSYDPRTDPIVRVEMRQLRLKLAAYYAGSGAADPILIEVPKGQYLAVISERVKDGTAIEKGRSPQRADAADSVSSSENLAPPVHHDDAIARWRWGPLAIVAVMGVAVFAAWSGHASLEPRASTSMPIARAPSVAVLPFTMLGSDAGDDGVAEGLTDEISSSLSRLDGLLVSRPTPRPSAHAVEEPSVDAIVDGSIRRMSGRVRVVARLTRTADGVQLWSSTFDRTGDSIDSDTEIASHVVRAVQQRIDPTSAQPFVRRSNDDPDAHALYVRARNLAHTHRQSDLLLAADLFERAIARDPGYAMAHAGLADAISVLAANGHLAPGDGIVRIRAAATRAIELDPTLGEALAHLAYLSAFVDWRWDEAEQQLRRAVALTPSHARIRAWLGQVLTTRGRFEEGLEELLVGQRLDPTAASITYAVGEAYFYSGRNEEALVQARRLLEINPRSWGAHNLMARAFMELGRPDDALAALRRSRGELWADALALVAEGDRAGARALLRARHREISDTQPFTIASLYASAGDTEQSLAWLQRAYALRQVDLVTMVVDPALAPARADPRFRQLASKIGL